ncbi:CBO0543 family protein [Paenibacillus xanthanilyticus]|uniref:CBO0543 family protein n=1 Tax=Paenibacillus xanthanilyticus TaxID=1783531 RepID=A0ABV8K950_9BACL
MNDKKETARLIDENVNQISKLIKEKIEIWTDQVVFSNLWWMGVILSIIPWVIWILYRKKSSTDRLLYAGFFASLVAVALDLVGDQFGFWHYRFNVIPVVPTYLPWDFTLMPVTIIWLIQFKPSVSPYLKAAVFALLTSYVAEPFFKWLLVYNPVNWRYTYSVPIQFVLYLAAHYMSKRNEFDKIS